MVPCLGRARLLPCRRIFAQAALLHRHSAAQRHRRPAHGACPQQHPAGYPLPLEADDRTRGAVDARDRPCRHRHPERGRKAARSRGDRPPRTGPRGLRRAGLEMAQRVGGADHQPAQAPRRLLRLGAGALHHGRGALHGGARGLRAPLRGRADLPRQPADQLVPALPHRPLRPRGRTRGEAGAALAPALPGQGRGTLPGRRHHPPRDDARRYRGGGPPRGRALCRPHRQERDSAAARPGDPGDRRRLRRPRIRHRGGEDHAGPRLQRLRGRQAPRPRTHQRARQFRVHQ